MPKSKKEPIPKHFSTLEEAGEFWDTHDLGDYWDQTEEVKMTFRPADKAYHSNMVEDVRKKLASLPESSHIRSAFPNNRLEEIARWIESGNLKDLKWAYWLPLFLFVHRHSVSKIQAFESDIDLVVRHSKQKQAAEIIQFLKAKPQDDRLWVGGVFETFVKSRLLKEKDLTVELDYILPNDKQPDLRLEVGGKPFYLECTVITESDEDREVWDRFMEAKKADSNVTLIRPGKFDSPNSKGPSLYYDCLRFYAKVYDKIAKGLDPKKSQMGEDGPNVLLVCFYSPRGPLSYTSPGVGWALDELLADQPKSGARLKDNPPGITDVSLLAWLDFTANDLHRKSRLDLKKYCMDFGEIVAAPKKVGAFLLFEGCSLKAARVNYNAKQAHQVSHHEIAELEKLFETLPSWA